MSFLDLTGVEVKEFKDVPDGEYHVQVEDCEIKTNDNKPDVEGLNFKCKILDGDYQNQYIFDTFYYKHTSEKAQEIALQKIKQYVLASGKPEVFETPKELVGGICIVKLKSREYNGKKYQQIAYFKALPKGTDESEGLFS